MGKAKYQEPRIELIYDDIDIIRTSMKNQGDGTWDNEDCVDSDKFFQ